jgi:hypothetical protein
MVTAIPEAVITFLQLIFSDYQVLISPDREASFMADPDS